MSRRGATIGSPDEGLGGVFGASMTWRASATASRESGTCTAIWSPSKSALKARQTSGWIWMALPSTSTGSQAWVPRRGSAGARVGAGGRADGAAAPLWRGWGGGRSFLPLQCVGEALQLVVARAGDGAAAPAVV